MSMSPLQKLVRDLEVLQRSFAPRATGGRQPAIPVKGERGERGVMGPAGPKGEKGDSIVGPRGPKGERGASGKDGRDGQDADVSLQEFLVVADRAVLDHEGRFDHTLLHDSFLLGTKKVDESGIGKGKFLQYDGGKLVYAEIPKAKETRSWNGGGGGTTLPDQTGNSGKYLTTDGSVLSWGTVSTTITGATLTTLTGFLRGNGTDVDAINTVTETEFGYLAGVTSAIQTQLGLKAPLASPTFTGVPAGPTASPGTNTTQLATTAFVLANATAPGGSTKQLQFNSAGSFGGAAGFEYQSGASPNVLIQAQNAAHVPLTVKGAGSQSANLQEWQNSSGTALSFVTSSGAFNIGNSAKQGTAATFKGDGTNSSAPGQIVVQSTGVSNENQFIDYFKSDGTLVYRVVSHGDTGNGSFQWQRGSSYYCNFGISKTGFVGVGGGNTAALNTLVGGDTLAGTLHVVCGLSSHLGVVVQAASSQSANLTSWNNSSGTPRSWITSDGRLVLGAAAATTGGNLLEIRADSTTFAASASANSSLFRCEQLGDASAFLLYTAVNHSHFDGLFRLHLNNASSSGYCCTFRHDGANGLWFAGQYGNNDILFSISPNGGSPKITAGSADLVLQTGGASNTIIFRATPSQTANLTEWRNSSSAVLAGVTKDGYGFLGSATNASSSVLHVAGSLATAYAAKTGTYTITATDSVINCTSGTFTVTLPTAVGCAGRMYTVKNSGTGVITVDADGSETIDGLSGYTLAVQYDLVTVVSTGAAWIIV